MINVHVDMQRGFIFRTYFRNKKPNKADYEENRFAGPKLEEQSQERSKGYRLFRISMSQSLEVEIICVWVRSKEVTPQSQKEREWEEVGMGATVLSRVHTGRRQMLPAHSCRRPSDLSNARILPLEFGC